MKEKKGRRKYDREFKEDALRLILEGGRTVRGVARDLGVHESMLHRWKKEYLEDREEAFPGKGHMKPHSDHNLPIAEDLVERDFSASGINQLWISDITYIWTWEGWMYLAAVMDVYNRQIVGWALHDRLNKALGVDSLSKSLQSCSPQPGLIFHSDQGSQYASDKVKKILKAWHIRQSMSHKGDCFDNVMMESFFSSLKKELVYLTTFHSKVQARRTIFEYIEIFYNRQRRHSALNQKSPLEYYQNATQAF